jgi:hypothetical protein
MQNPLNTRRRPRYNPQPPPPPPPVVVPVPVAREMPVYRPPVLTASPEAFATPPPTTREMPVVAPPTREMAVYRPPVLTTSPEAFAVAAPLNPVSREMPVYRPPILTASPEAFAAPPPPTREMPVYRPGVVDPTTVDPALATRERIVTGVRGEDNPMSGLERAQNRLRAVYNTPIEDENGRLRSGGNVALNAAGNQAQRTLASGRDDLAPTIGAALGGFLGGIFKPKTDEGLRRQAELAAARQGYGIESAMDEQATNKKLKEAQAKNTGLMPEYRSEEQRRKQLGEDNKALATQQRVLASIFNKADEFDVTDPANADTVEAMRAAKLPVYSKRRDQKVELVLDPRNGEYNVVAINQKTGAATSSAPLGADGKPLKTSTKEQMSAEEKERDRKARKEVANILVGSRERIAATSNQIQRDRISMDKEQFSIKYPGAGKFVTNEDVVQKAKSLNAYAGDVIKDLTDKGYTIIQD